jgi:hypothetical protein
MEYIEVISFVRRRGIGVEWSSRLILICKYAGLRSDPRTYVEGIYQLNPVDKKLEITTVLVTEKWSVENVQVPMLIGLPDKNPYCAILIVTPIAIAGPKQADQRIR